MKLSWADHLSMASKLSSVKLTNAMALYGSYHYSRLTGKPFVSALPLSISVEPTTSCNLRCPECPSGLRSFTRPTGMLNSTLFESIIDQLSPTLCSLTFYFQGEPYLNPQFLNMVRYAKEKKIYTVTSTNAHYLTEAVAKGTVASGLDRLIISIDGTTQETYESYRVGGNLEKALAGARNIVAWKNRLNSRTPHVVFQFLVVKPNEHQVPEVFRLAREIKVDEVKLKTAQIYDFDNGSPLIPANPRFSRYSQRQDGTYALKNRLLNHCWKMWHSCVVTWDGKVVPCCFDKDAHHVLGDLNQKSFRQIWFGDAYREFRGALLRSRSEIEICRNCTEGTKVWA